MTTTTVYTDVARRHDFVLLFDVTDGNPNGDPDGGNLPRTDPETMQGLVTDVALKRKVRDWVDAKQGSAERFKIYVQHRGILANEQKRGFTETKQEPSDRPNETVRKWMCNNFYDIRMFGAVMATGKTDQKSKQWNAGQVRGPMQLTFARSVDPIFAFDVAIARVALTNATDTRRTSDGEDDEKASTGQLARKAIVPYGLYCAYGFFNPHLAEQTKVSAEDLGLFWQALQGMWDLDHSAARGLMGCRGLYVFSHANKLGNAPAHALFDRVTAALKPGEVTPRRFGQYAVTLDEAGLPDGVTLTRLVG